ncbi:MAG: hypothetical protein PT116_13990 [Aphanizomenon gracile PMC638.10]|nr:hypothetical protein [Aphanizomenon gracile PMC638.10]
MTKHTLLQEQPAQKLACLIRRLRAFCGKEITDTTCIATSATIVDPEPGSNAGAEICARFFGVSRAC